MAFDSDTQEVQDDDPGDALYADIAPYLVEPGRVREIISEAITSGDPEDYLNKLMEKSGGSLKIDLRIVLNRIRKK
ncbi:MAG: hypothetical protein ACMUIG_01180 [Thermoplasmatota archaeon]